MENIISNNEESVANILKILEKHSMQCRCGNLATPVNLQGHTYKCSSCNKVYEGINYDFTRLTSISSKIDSFNEALNTLSNKRQSINSSSNILNKHWIKIRH